MTGGKKKLNEQQVENSMSSESDNLEKLLAVLEKHRVTYYKSEKLEVRLQTNANMAPAKAQSLGVLESTDDELLFFST